MIEKPSLFSRIGSHYGLDNEANQKLAVIRLVTHGISSQAVSYYDHWRMSFRQTLINNDVRDFNAFQYNLLYNTGDFFNGYINSLATYALTALIAPRLPDRIRSSLSFLVGAGSVIFAETISPYPFMGRPDLDDIPAGIAGAGLFLGVNYIGRALADRFVEKQLNKD